MNKKYYYLKNDKEYGPVSFQELKEMRITRFTYVWCEGMENWKEAGEIDELSGIFSSIKKKTKARVPGKSNVKSKSDNKDSRKKNIQIAIITISIIIISIVIIKFNSVEDKIIFHVYTSKTGAFSVVMPGAVDSVSHSISTEYGKRKAYKFTSMIDGAVLIVSYFDYPFFVLQDYEPVRLIKSARNTDIKNLGCSLLTENEITLNNNPGIHFIASCDKDSLNLTFEGKYFLVDKRLFKAFMIFEKNKISQEFIDGFLNSFKIREVESKEVIE